MQEDRITQNMIDFNALVTQIQTTHEMLQENARLVINRHITVKAWLTGYYIVEFEQKGQDRAKYGNNLLKCISQRLGSRKFSVTTLKVYRQFYQTYPQLSNEVAGFVKGVFSIGQSVTDQLRLPNNLPNEISLSVTDLSTRTTVVPSNGISVKPSLLFNKLSFTHLTHSVPMDES